GGPPVRATTHLDWQEIVFDTGSPDELYVGSGQAMDAALASGAHGVAFRPRGLDRSAPEIQAGYRANGVDGPPMLGGYTDGGTIANQPLGRAVNLTQAIDRDDPRDGARRLHLLITPDPAIRQPAIDAWTDSGTEPRWLVSGERIVTLLLSQHLYD